MCSSLNADLHLVNLKPSPACICGHGFEDCIHFFLECPFYNENRAILFNKLKNYVVTIELILAGDENLTCFLLFLFVRNLSSSSYPSFYPYVLNILFHLIFLYIYFIINV